MSRYTRNVLLETKQKGATNENPNVFQFLKNNHVLRVVNSIRIETSKWKTHGSKSSQPILQPLPKHK